jgi:integrase
VARRWGTDAQASTHRFYTFNLELHLYPTLGTQPVASITRTECRRVITACRDKGLKVASLKAVQRTLSAVLSQAVDDGMLQANPAFRMGKHLRQGDEQKAEIQPLTREEAQEFLDTVSAHWPEYYAFFLCALRTGMRLGELLALQWGDVDVAGRFLEVRRNLVSGRLTTPKNHNRRRVDMSLRLTETLEQRLKDAKKAALKAGRRVPAWVFANSDGNAPDGDNIRRRVFEKALTKAKLRHVRIHDLRHTYATHLIQQGESLAYVDDVASVVAVAAPHEVLVSKVWHGFVRQNRWIGWRWWVMHDGPVRVLDVRAPCRRVESLTVRGERLASVILGAEDAHEYVSGVVTVLGDLQAVVASLTSLVPQPLALNRTPALGQPAQHGRRVVTFADTSNQPKANTRQYEPSSGDFNASRNEARRLCFNDSALHSVPEESMWLRRAHRPNWLPCKDLRSFLMKCV